MKRPASIIRWFLLLPGMLLLGGCAGQDSLVGRWQSDDSDQLTIEFRSDGTCDFFGPNGDPLEASWSRNGERLVINFGGNANMTWNISNLTDQELQFQTALEDWAGEARSWIRVTE